MRFDLARVQRAPCRTSSWYVVSNAWHPSGRDGVYEVPCPLDSLIE